MFSNRFQAGQLLAEKIKAEIDIEQPEKLCVLSIPHGGVPVGHEIAKYFSCKHDVILMQRLKTPDQHVTLGVVVEQQLYLQLKLVQELKIESDYLNQESTRIVKELKANRCLYGKLENKLNVSGQTVIIADDGATSGTTIKAPPVIFGIIHPKN